MGFVKFTGGVSGGPTRTLNIPSHLSGQSEAIIKLLQQAVVTEGIAIMLEIHQILQGDPGSGGTPIKTGWASSNWIFSVQSPFRDVVGSKKAVSYDESKASISEALEFDISDANLYLSNNVPYIQVLNFGINGRPHSHQSSPPLHWIEQAIDITVRKRDNKELASNIVGFAARFKSQTGLT